MVKAINIKTNEWIVGYFLCLKKRYYVISEFTPVFDDGEGLDISEYAEVKIESICNDTGLFSKKSQCKIWENDILKFKDCNKNGEEFINRAKIVWKKGKYTLSDFRRIDSEVYRKKDTDIVYNIIENESEVIGSAITNPDMLCSANLSVEEILDNPRTEKSEEIINFFIKNNISYEKMAYILACLTTQSTKDALIGEYEHF